MVKRSPAAENILSIFMSLRLLFSTNRSTIGSGPCARLIRRRDAPTC